MPKKLNINPGDRYGFYTIVEEAEKSKWGGRRFVCRCDCGNVRTVTLSNLRSSHTRSCGCYMRRTVSMAKTIHGLHATRLYEIWCSMKKRCLNPNNRAYKWYGGKGVRIHSKWLKFISFYEWAMANGYGDDLTIERVDVDGNYEPGNCTFIPIEMQNYNKVNSRIIAHNGQSKCVAEWAKEYGLSDTTLIGRLNRGWPIKDALSPSQRGGRND